MKDTDYAFAVARIRANEKYLLTSADMESLITAKSEKEAFSLLSAKKWAVDENSDIAAAVDEQNKALWALLSESVPDKKELEIFTVSNDFYNIKAALKCAFSEKDAEKYFAYPTSIDLEKTQKALETRDFSALPDDFAVPMKKAYEDACVTRNGQSADIILDSAALKVLDCKAKKSDCALVKEICTFIIDCANIKIAVRCAKTKKSLSFCERAVADCGTLDSKKLCSLACEGEEALFAYLEKTPYAKAAKLIATDTAAFEKWCDDETVAIIKKAKYMFFGFEPICAYYYAKQAEIKTVSLIFSAKKGGLSQDSIRERVRALYV